MRAIAVTQLARSDEPLGADACRSAADVFEEGLSFVDHDAW
jgi:hypothetical protein